MKGKRIDDVLFVIDIVDDRKLRENEKRKKIHGIMIDVIDREKEKKKKI